MNQAIKNKLRSSASVVDLGCGNNPVKWATTAVDCYIEPKERCNMRRIDVNAIEGRGIKFVNAKIDEKLPFGDKEFDFAYSHHAFEHLDNPSLACEEMIRIAKSGVIITPSFFAELIFGRVYHKWLVMQRENAILFFKKRDFENCRFGDHPLWDSKLKKWTHNESTNPFDILLNDGNWYSGKESFDRLSYKIKNLYRENDPVMEVNFLWKDKFQYYVYE
jgi:ubiquinone/menaquinone biosynthesis C-methylase UbiE